MRFVFMGLLCLFPLLSIATIHQVPDEYQTIQAAIEASEDGDTVLVSDGLYAENLIFGGRLITVASHFLMDGNTAHRDQTIIDPPIGSEALATVLFDQQEDSTAQLVGFTLRNGRVGVLCDNASPTIRENRIYSHVFVSQGGVVGVGISLNQSNAHVINNRIDNNHGLFEEFVGYGVGIGANESDPVIVGNIIEQNIGLRGAMTGIQGAGIGMVASNGRIEGNLIRDNTNWGARGGGICLVGSSPWMRNNLIEGNRAYGGAGIGIYDGSAPTIEGSIIRHNRFEMDALASEVDNGTGVSVINASPQLGTPEAPVSIYDNLAAQNSDLLVQNSGPLTVHIDTFTVATPDDRFLLAEDCTVNIAYGKHPDPSPIPELYVSPDGNDSNTGTSPDAPLRTIRSAIVRQSPTPSFKPVIHLMEGDYVNGIGGELFPLALQDSLIIRGDENVVLNGAEGNVFESDGAQGARVDSVVIAQGWKAFHLINSQVDLVQVTVISCGWAVIGSDSEILLDDCFISRSTATQTDEPYLLFDYNGAVTTIQNSIFDQIGSEGIYFLGGESEISGCRFRGTNGYVIKYDWGASFSLRNSLFSGNSSLTDVSIVVIRGDSSGDIVNCTFADNYSRNPAGAAVWSNSSEAVDVRNSIFWGNRTATDHQQVYLGGEEGTLAYCAVEGGFPAGEHVLTDNPMLSTDGEYLLAPYSLAIDAGDPDTMYNDPENEGWLGHALWPGQGLLRNDLGAYGGPTPLETAIVVGVEESPAEQPDGFQLLSAYPNPFNATTTIRFQLDRADRVRAVVHDLLGREVRLLADQTFHPGQHRLAFQAEDLPSGIYFLSVGTNQIHQTQKLVVLK